MSYSVIIPSYKNEKYLDICLQSLIEGQTQKNQIVVVLDGFEEMYADTITKFPMVQFLPLQSNVGMPSAINYGVFLAENDWIVVINDDNVMPLNWDINLDKSKELHNNVNNCIFTIDQIEASQSIFNFHVKDFSTEVESFSLKDFQEYEPTIAENKLTNDGEIFPFVMRKKDFMLVGGFDILYPSPFVVDWDFFLKLELNDMEFVRTHLLHSYHFGSKATKNSNESQKFNLSEQEAFGVFQFKWGFNPINGMNNSKKPTGTIRGIKW